MRNTSHQKISSLFVKALYILVFTLIYMCGPMCVVVYVCMSVCLLVFLAGSSEFFVKCVRSCARDLILFGVVRRSFSCPIL